MASTPVLTYRSRLLASIGWAMIVLVVLVVASVALAEPTPVWLWLPLAAAGGLVAGWLLHRCYVAPRVVATDRGVRVVNPFGTTELSWIDIARFESEPMLTIVGWDGTTVRAWAVQHASTARLVGHTSAGESVVDALTRQLAATTSLPDAY